MRSCCHLLADLDNSSGKENCDSGEAYAFAPVLDRWCLVQVLESRVDHTRVVLMLRKNGNLPLVKDYLMSVQKTNLSAVNEAVNELLIEEEDFEVRNCCPTYCIIWLHGCM